MSTLPLQKSIRDNAEELKDYVRDLNSWLKQVKEEDNKLIQKQKVTSQEKLPPIRRAPSPSGTSEKNENKKKKTVETSKATRISSCDYGAWDKFNVEEALKSESSSEDEQGKLVKPKDDQSQDSKSNKQLKDATSSSISQTNSDKADKYKEEGNKYYSKGKYSDAVAKYTQGMALNPANPLLPANRAMAYIKLKKYKAAESDCNRALELDPKYVKSFMRRATARVWLEDLEGAINDYQKVLALEPLNKEAKKELENLTNKLNSSQTTKKSSSCLSEITKQPKIEELREEKKPHIKVSESSFPKKLQEQSLVPLVNIPVVEVESEEEIERLLNPSVTKTQELSCEVDKKASTALSNLPSKVEEVTVQPNLPRTPRTSHQFSQDWHKIRHFQQLKLPYLKSISPAFFSSTEIDADLTVELVESLCDQNVEATDALPLFDSLVKSRGFFINLAFLDGQQKKVFENILKKIENLTLSEEIEKLKEIL